MRKVLLTGFEAFGTTPVNPAEQVARRLDGAAVNGALFPTPSSPASRSSRRPSPSFSPTSSS
jgi:pyrrolidone-carboxylate peptidase